MHDVQWCTEPAMQPAPQGKVEISTEDHAALLRASQERDRLHALINAPELHEFLRGVHLEAVHQVERWGTATDRAKRPADWFWLVGYLAGKALHAAVQADEEKGPPPLHQHRRCTLQLVLCHQRA